MENKKVDMMVMLWQYVQLLMDLTTERQLVKESLQNSYTNCKKLCIVGFMTMCQTVCLYCLHDTCNTVKRFETSQSKMFHPVCGRPTKAQVMTRK